MLQVVPGCQGQGGGPFPCTLSTAEQQAAEWAPWSRDGASSSALTLLEKAIKIGTLFIVYSAH